MTDLDGNTIQDASGHVGFPGFDGMEATVSLAWVASRALAPGCPLVQLPMKKGVRTNGS